MLLNITNGDYLNAKLSKENNGEFFPFREAIIQGEVTSTILNSEFIKIRAKSLGVSQEFYKEQAKEIFAFASCHEKYSKIKLWFGKDTFCQLNLLTLLTYLEQINYIGKIELVLIDDETGNIIKDGIEVLLGQYSKIYKTLLIDRLMPINFGVIQSRAIELYFDFLSPNGELAKLIRQNQNLNEEELLVLLLENSKEYGLSDLNVKDLISRVKIW